MDLVRLCGGTEGILKMWTKTIEKDLKAGGFKAHGHIASILKLMEYCKNTNRISPTTARCQIRVAGDYGSVGAGLSTTITDISGWDY